MNECCKDQKTAYCPTCGKNLKGITLVGLRVDLQGRLAKATNGTMAGWLTYQKKPGSDQVKAKKGIDRTNRTIEKLNCWIDLLDIHIAAQARLTT